MSQYLKLLAISLASATTAFAGGFEAAETCVQDSKNTIESKRVCVKQCFEEETSNSGMKLCASLSFDVEDQNLNDIYKKMIASFKNEDDKEIKARLVKAQRAWIPSRDADCEFQAAEMLGGSGESLIFTSCLAEKTKERANFLKQLGYGETSCY